MYVYICFNCYNPPDIGFGPPVNRPGSLAKVTTEAGTEVQQALPDPGPHTCCCIGGEFF